MKLLLDLGNTRLKACIYDGELTLVSTVFDIDTLRTWLGHNADALQAVAIACVSDELTYQRVMASVGRYYDVARVYRARYAAHLLETAYEHPERLGIDRWLALLPLRHEPHAIIVDAGTACTIDVVRAGRHAGGYILPGLRLQRDALAQQTASVSFPTADYQTLDLGITTAACVGHGSLRAVLALAQAVCDDYRAAPYRLVLTGGDSHYLSPYLSAELRPLLVFEGLLIALTDCEEGSA